MPYADVDGVRLQYERAGSGDPELLFVPGWCCDTSAFQPQFDHFAQRHAVTAIELRGCGRSDRPPDGYTIRDLTDDVAGLARAVGIERPVVVGHSLGGMIAVELAGRYPSLPRALVLVDPGPIHPTPETMRIFEAFAEGLAGPDGEWVRRLRLEDMGARDPALARWIVELMSAVPLQTATEVIKHLGAWNGVGALGLCTLPILLLRAEFRPDDARLLQIKPDITVGTTVGAGHFHQLEVPDQVNAMIERFLEIET